MKQSNRFSHKTPHEHSTWTWLAWRFMRSLMLCFVGSMILFALIWALPGDAATNSAAGRGAEAVARARADMGLDQPLFVRYMEWLRNLTHGDLGHTLVTKKPVTSVIQTPILGTLTVAAIVFIALIVITLPLAVYMGARVTRTSQTVSGISVALSAIPEFVVSILLVGLLCKWARIFPVLSVPGSGKTAWETPVSLMMPSLCLWVMSSASLLRRIRGIIATYSEAAYVKDAYLAGLSPRKVLFRHLLPTAAYPIAQLFAQVVPYLLGGAVVVETVTSFPGMGFLLVKSTANRDAPTVMAVGILLMVATAFAFMCADFFGKRFERVAAVI